MATEELDIRSITKNARHVGNVFSWRVYGLEKIYITLRKDVKLPVGSYVFVKDDDGLPIIYQVANPTYYRYSFDFEKRLISHGGISRDEAHTYDCIGVLVGKMIEVEKEGRKSIEIQPPRYPIPPLSEVYECPKELVGILTKPPSEPVLEIGDEPLTGLRVKIALRALIRQGLLISGAQGTGKTTALLTLIVRSLEAYPYLRFLILDWTGEFSVLKRLSPKFSVQEVSWDDLMKGCIYSDPELLLKLIAEEDPRARGAPSEVLKDAIIICLKEGQPITKRNLLSIVGEVQRDDRGRSMIVGGRFSSRKPATIETVRSIIGLSRWIPESERETMVTVEQIIQQLRENNITIIDFSRTQSEHIPDDFELKRRFAEMLVEHIWDTARIDRSFGCIIVSDEAHRICPERGYGETSSAWIRLATEGGRNGCPLWLVARRLSLVTKSVTTELQQNFFCFNVEDVDRRRISEDLGETFASLLGSLPPGEAIVKSAAGFRIPGQVIHVCFDQILKPSSAEYGLEERFPERGVREIEGAQEDSI